MNYEKYLNLIEVNKKNTLNYLYLAQLQINHILSIPFENLDIQAGITISLLEKDLFTKIIENKRGGFCYELNYLFYFLLKELGFDVYLASAQFYHPAKKTFAPEFDHLTLVVQLEKKYLVDVGFGDSFRVPIPIPDGQIKDISGTYRVYHNEGEEFFLQRLNEDTWLTQYKFKLVPRDIKEFYPMCVYHQTSPDTIFTQRKLCTIATPMGRVTISDESLTVTQNRLKEKFIIKSPDEFNEKLKIHFGMDFNKIKEFNIDKIKQM
ncbi:MAG: arylamine N-acetyltransferase [bacterium]